MVLFVKQFHHLQEDFVRRALKLLGKNIKWSFLQRMTQGITTFEGKNHHAQNAPVLLRIVNEILDTRLNVNVECDIDTDNIMIMPDNNKHEPIPIQYCYFMLEPDRKVGIDLNTEAVSNNNMTNGLKRPPNEQAQLIQEVKELSIALTNDINGKPFDTAMLSLTAILGELIRNMKASGYNEETMDYVRSFIIRTVTKDAPDYKAKMLKGNNPFLFYL
jgi:hypothetical protein